MAHGLGGGWAWDGGSDADLAFHTIGAGPFYYLWGLWGLGKPSTRNSLEPQVPKDSGI